MRSLRKRLLLAALVALILALGVAGVALTFVFERAVRARVVADLGDHVDLLTQGLRLDAAGALTLLREPPDPRFERPQGGFYWQLGRDGRTELRSRSLAQASLAWSPTPQRSGVTSWNYMPGPAGQELIAVERQVTIDSSDGAIPVRFLVGLDDRELLEARLGFFEAVIPSLIAIGFALMGGVLLFLRFGLSPLERLKSALADVRTNAKARIEGDFPEEIRPLVAETNALIAARNADMEAARARAGDLAHALKTPLAVISAQVRDLEATGHADIANEISGEVARLQGVIMRELARARANLQSRRQAKGSEIAPAIERTCRSLSRIAAYEAIHFDRKLAGSPKARVDETDLLEMVGNLIENAAKWATSTVQVKVSPTQGGLILITVTDDGPGMGASDIEAAMRAGVRLDERVPGHGFGLGITRELAEAYGGGLGLARDGQLGGLVATLALPTA
jgi:signal transduction histidine kinase